MGNPAGGLLLMLVGVMLLLMYVTGRLEWLFGLARDVQAGRAAYAAPAAVKAPPPPVGTTAPTPPAKPSSPLPAFTA